MNGLIFLASVVAVVVIAWLLLERFAPDRARGYKTIILNVVASLPIVGPELASLLMEHGFDRFISQDNLPWYVGALVILNIFARIRTDTPVGGTARDMDWDVGPR